MVASKSVLHHSILGAALQRTFGLFQTEFGLNEGTVISVQLEILVILWSIPPLGLVAASFAVDNPRGEVRRMDIGACDDRGTVCMAARF